MEPFEIQINVVEDLQALKKTNYKGIDQAKLREGVVMLIQRHKYMIYLLSVIRLHIGNQSHAMAIRTMEPNLFYLQTRDMVVHESEIELMLKFPSFGFKWSKTNYSYWVKRFTQNLGPISRLREKYMYSSGNECFYLYDSSEYVKYTFPKIYSLNDKFNLKYRNKKTITWNKIPVYDVESYFDLFFEDSVNEYMLKDFMNSSNWKDFVHDDRDRFLDGLSAILTGYYRDGKPNKIIFNKMKEREASEFQQLQNTNPERTFLTYLIQKIWPSQKKKSIQLPINFVTADDLAFGVYLSQEEENDMSQ